MKAENADWKLVDVMKIGDRVTLPQSKKFCSFLHNEEGIIESIRQNGNWIVVKMDNPNLSNGISIMSHVQFNIKDLNV